MQVFGMHVLDALVVVVYIIIMLYIGYRASHKIKDEEDFYLSGRGLGKFFQFFLTFGSMTDANGAASISSEVFRQGVGGVWIGFQTLFLTPFYWFSGVWFRRVRLITMGDLFTDRFRTKSIAVLYAAFSIFLATFAISLGYLASYKVTSAMLLKEPASLTLVEKKMVEDYKTYTNLRAAFTRGDISDEDYSRYQELDSLVKKGEIKPFVSHVKPLPFYIIYALLVGIYIIMGGLRAAAITDAVQGILIIFFSLVLIPMGLVKLGGFSGLHEQVPEYMFALFGSVQMSDYTWYSIAAITFTSLIQIFGLLHNMTISGSAKSEFAARFGQISGGFTKRFMLIAWLLCGLIAYGLYRDKISDPDNAWGFMSASLLIPGLMGMMIAGMLAANMSTVDAGAVSISGLFVRNLYEPLFPNRSQKHYVLVGRITTATVLILGVGIAMFMRGIVPLLLMMITLGAYWGAVTFLVFFWRRLTAPAVIAGLIFWVVFIALAPLLLPLSPSFRQHPSLTVQTPGRTIEVLGGATGADVQAGLAETVGQVITQQHVVAPKSIYFDKVARVDERDPDSPLEGIGRFHIEVWALGKLGLPVEKMQKAGVVTCRWLVDGLLPFILCIVFSLLTKATSREVLDRFYVKMKTPVAPTPEEDAMELEKSYADPARFNHQKLFPKSNWEFTKWNRVDTIGFVACWGFVLLVLVTLWGILQIGR